jgi:SAM-dependent methyltransferase
MREEEIRPADIFAEYLRLATQDTTQYFADVPRAYISCPACGSEGEAAFAKHGFDYQSCASCLTLYVSPRPAAAAFSRYYTESPSAKFWATTFYKETAAARREKLWNPKARLIEDALRRYRATNHHLVDIGGGYGLFAEAMRELCSREITIIEPSPYLAEVCRGKRLVVIEKFLESVGLPDLPRGPKAYVSFELFEHLHDPAAFVRHLSSLMQPGDLLLFTTLSGTGADIQALWQDSNAVSPPHHLNFFNPRSIRILLQRLGMEVLEVTTPGKLDVDILLKNRHLIKDRFWRTFAGAADEATQQRWQNLLSETGWSSHMLTICRKPAAI